MMVEESDISIKIGSQVTVTIDRPLGSTHPKYPNLQYPVNYGYVKGVMAADGEDQDAYVIGVEEPVKEYTGILIAIIHRLDDVEDKWVVAPVGMSYTKEEILKQLAFQEKYFHIEIQME
ncbi:MAG: inorganic pyrophosphatase [Lentisphaeria bacterium]|nr:inorganic pyrophosphatase [Lentisphaeria bacterium]